MIKHHQSDWLHIIKFRWWGNEKSSKGDEEALKSDKKVIQVNGGALKGDREAVKYNGRR